MKTCVVIATYNGSKYIIEQLESIKKQTKNIDAVYICDDNSQDKTYELIKNYIAVNNFQNWSIRKNNKNIGWKENFRQLIIDVPEDFDVIFLCDQDDIWYENKVEDMCECLMNDSEISLLVSDIEIEYENNKVKKNIIAHLGFNYYQQLTFGPRMLDIRRPGCAMAIKRKEAQECFNKYYFEGLAHDKFLWLCSISTYKIGYIRKKLMMYRRYSENASGFNKKENRFIIKKNDSIDQINYMKAIKRIKKINSKNIEIIDRNINFQLKRQLFFDTKNIFVWMMLFRYIRYYTNYRMWIGDLYYTYKCN